MCPHLTAGASENSWKGWNTAGTLHLNSCINGCYLNINMKIMNRGRFLTLDLLRQEEKRTSLDLGKIYVDDIMILFCFAVEYCFQNSQKSDRHASQKKECWIYLFQLNYHTNKMQLHRIHAVEKTVCPFRSTLPSSDVHLSICQSTHRHHCQRTRLNGESCTTVQKQRIFQTKM